MSVVKKNQKDVDMGTWFDDMGDFLESKGFDSSQIFEFHEKLYEGAMPGGVVVCSLYKKTYYPDDILFVYFRDEHGKVRKTESHIWKMRAASFFLL